MSRLADKLAELERRRQSRVLLLTAIGLDIDILPSLYDMLGEMGRCARLDVLLSTRGGCVSAARRIALLLHDFTDHLSFLVPYHCQSAGTILTLSGREILAGPMALFSPVDPHLETAEDQPPGTISAEDVRLFPEMAQRWFGLETAEARQQALAILCENIFPTTLTSFYRGIKAVEALCLELLSLHEVTGDPDRRRAIVDSLLSGYNSHSHMLTMEDLARIGLPARRDREIDPLCWSIIRDLPESPAAEPRSLLSGMLATTGRGLAQFRSPGRPVSGWEPWSEVE